MAAYIKTLLRPTRLRAKSKALRATVTKLALAPDNYKPRKAELPEGFALRLYENPPLAFYRKLYDAVGRQWHWVNRRHISNRALRRIIHHPHTRIYVLWDGVHPAGYIEVNLRSFPIADIVFVGIKSSYIGRGLGSAMFQQVLHEIIQTVPNRIIIQTCTLDHPSGLILYQKRGFVPYARRRITIYEPPDSAISAGGSGQGTFWFARLSDLKRMIRGYSALLFRLRP